MSVDREPIAGNESPDGAATFPPVALDEPAYTRKNRRRLCLVRICLSWPPEKKVSHDELRRELASHGFTEVRTTILNDFEYFERVLKCGILLIPGPKGEKIGSRRMRPLNWSGCCHIWSGYVALTLRKGIKSLTA